MTKNDEPSHLPEVNETVLSRRTALARLGLAATAVYVAPTILHIDRSANAFVVPSPCSSGRGRRRRGCNNKGGNNKSGKSKGGGRSGRGRQSRNNRRRNKSRRHQANNRSRRNSRGTNRRRW